MLLLCLRNHVSRLMISQCKCPRFALFIQVSHLYTMLHLPEPARSAPLFSLSLLLTTLEGLCHFCIFSSDFFNGDLGLSSSSKSVTSILLSSMFYSFSISSSSVSFCSSSGISTFSGSILVLNWSAWANIGSPLFSSIAVFYPFCWMNFTFSGSASLFLLYQTFSSVANDMVFGALICLPINADGLCFLSARGFLLTIQ